MEVWWGVLKGGSVSEGRTGYEYSIIACSNQEGKHRLGSLNDVIDGVTLELNEKFHRLCLAHDLRQTLDGWVYIDRTTV